MEYLILLFVIVPLFNLLHELGHAFFVKIFGGKVTKIALGTGRSILSFKNFQIKSTFFVGGEFSSADLKINNKFSKVLISLGGILFTSILAILMSCLMVSGVISHNYLTNGSLIYLILISIGNAIPVTYSGADTDGKQILQVIKRKSLSNLLKDEKNHEEILAHIDAEIERLKRVSHSTRYEFMRAKYIREIFYKSEIQQKMGRTKDAAVTLQGIRSDITDQPARLQILYYNNLLYYLIISDYKDNIDELYEKLTELLSIKENKIYESAAIIDTIQTYKAYKGAIQ